MGGNSETDDFEDDEGDEVAGDSDLDLDRVIRDMDIAKRRAPRTGGEPAWRRLEQRLEQKRTAELISDFEDYDVGREARDGGASPKGKPRRGR